MKRIICFIFGHRPLLEFRKNGSFWGWNVYTCKRCGKRYDSLID